MATNETAGPPPRLAPEPPPARLIRVPLRDLPLTPEIERFVEESLEMFRRYRRPDDRAWYTDQAKLQFYFSGLNVAYLTGEPEGKVVIHVGKVYGEGPFECVTAVLTPEQRRRVRFCTPLLKDENYNIIPPLYHVP